jgi:hypothetical protein
MHTLPIMTEIAIREIAAPATIPPIVPPESDCDED